MRFVVIAAQRTGSSHLVTTLSGHPEILCHGNIFASQMMPVLWFKNRSPGKSMKAEKRELIELRDRDPDAFLEKIFSMGQGRPHVGFKIFPGQNDDALEKLIENASIRKIVLFRRNVLANFASKTAANETGKWGVAKEKLEQGKPFPETPSVEFVEAQFLSHWNKYVKYYGTVIQKLNQSGQHFQLVDYEDINSNPLLQNVVAFVGANSMVEISVDAQKKQQVKLHTNDILERFSNPDVVRQFLKSRDLLHWSYEGESSFTGTS